MAQAKLQITVISAENLYNADGFLAGKSDPYVICEVPGQPNMKFQTQTLNNDLNPVWNHVGEIEGFMDGDTLEFQVWDSDTFPKPDQLLGKAMLTAQDFYPNGIEGPLLLADSKTNATLTVRVIVLETTDPTQDPNLVMEGQEGVDYQQVEYQQGMMQGEMAMAEQVTGPQTLHINIMNARGLYNADGILAGKSDPYCICLIPEKKHVKITTDTINNCLDPDWNFTGLIHGFEAGDSLEFQVWDSDTFPKPDQLLGSVTLSPQDFANNPGGIEGVLQLSGGLSKEMGTLEVKIAVDAQATIDDAVAAEAHAAHHSSGHAATAGSSAQQPGAKRLSITQQTVEKLAGAKMAKLKVTIFSASGLYNADGFLAGKSDPYVICQVPESKAQKFKTKVMANTLEPSWNHLGVINGFVVGHTLELLVYDSDTPPKPDQLLGKVVLSSDDFFPQGLEGALLLAESKAAEASISVRIEVLPDTKDTGLAGGVRITSGGTYQIGQARPSVYQYTTGQPIYYQQPLTTTAGAIQYMAPSPTYTYTTVPPTVVQGAVAQTAFDAIDTNHDGVITRSEFATAVAEPTAVQPVATKVEYASAPLTYTAQAPVVYTMPPQPTATTATTIGEPIVTAYAGTTVPAATAMTAPAADLSATTRAPVVSYITTGMPATAATASAVLPAKSVVTAAPTTVTAPATYTTLAPGSPVSAYVKPVATASSGTVVQPTVTTAAPAAPVTFAQAPAASYRLPGGAARTTYVSAATSAGSGTPYTVVAAPSATKLGAAATYAAPSILTSSIAAAPVATQTAAPTATRVYAAPPGATYTMAPTMAPTFATMAPVMAPGATLFDRIDKNHDGVISRAEFSSAVR